MRVLITGHEGFVGKNLKLRLSEDPSIQLAVFGRSNEVSELKDLVKDVDVIVHLAGENRPKNPEDFDVVNYGLTRELCDALKASNSKARIVFTSSIQARQDNPYGNSKRKGEEVLRQFSEQSLNSVVIYRLPNVFGKWCRPNYNSVVATFCHNISQDLPIQINDADTEITLNYVDDVIAGFVKAFDEDVRGAVFRQIEPEYRITLGALADQLKAFKSSRESLITERVGEGLTRALYSTYVSYLRPEQFAYDLTPHADERGVFVEMLKSKDSGQFSFFTAKPGITRGGHYHHSKTEKFLVISGTAKFGFRHMLTSETFETVTSGDRPQVVETIPGWTHDIKNIGDSDLIVMLWANEIFDRFAPDTITSKV